MDNYIIHETCKNMRALARQAMAGKWKIAFTAVLIFTACTTLPVVILDNLFGIPVSDMVEMFDPYLAAEYEGIKLSFASSLYTLLVTGPFELGITIFFIELIRNRKSDLGHTFAGFEHFFKTIGLMIVIGILTALWTLLFIVPGIIASLRYSQAYYILADDPNKGIMECIRESKRIMKGNKLSYFCLTLTFLGWTILAGIVMSILIFAVEATGLTGMGYDLLDWIVTCIPLIGVETYIYGGLTVFYELLIGNLRPAHEGMPPLSQDVPEIPVENGQNNQL